MARVKRKDHEKLDDANIKRVIELLDAQPPITKKVACEILNISYNTSRLNKIIQEYKDRIEYAIRRRKMNRGKPIKEAEAKYIIIEYLKGGTIAGIAKDNYRSAASIKKCLIDYQVPLHESNISYWSPAPIPDENVESHYEEDELVWAARYNCVAQIKSVHSMTDEGPVYAIWVFGKHMENAYQPWYELGALPAINKLNIKKDDITITDVLDLNYG